MFGERQLAGQPSDVSIDRESGQVKGHAAYHVGRLAPNAGQRDKVLQRGRYLASEAVHDALGHTNQVARLAGVEASRLYDPLQFGDISDRQILGGGVAGKQRRRHHVDPDVSRLRRQDRGGQQLERVPVVQFANGDRILLGEATGHLAGAALRSSRRAHRVRGYVAATPATLPRVRTLDIKRQFDAGEIADVSGLLAAVERADGHRPLSDHLWLDLVEGGREGFAGLVAWEPGHEHPVAYAQLSRGNDSWALELAVHPHHRYEMMAIGPELLTAAVDVVAHEGGGHVHWWVFEPTAAHEQLARNAGLTPGRRLYQMRRSLPVGAPDELVTRAFVPGQDEEAWLRVNNRAFGLHPEQGGWDLATLVAREREAWFDADGFRIHERNGELAGFCWTKVHPDADPVLGEIYVIAVDPAFHGLGLGKSLTLAGLDYLAGRGIPVAMLYVDADNVAALALYRNLGFEIHRTDRAFIGDIKSR